MNKKRITSIILIFGLFFTSAFSSFAGYVSGAKSFKYDGLTIPAYDGDSYEKVHKNDPRFTDAQKEDGLEGFEKYSKLDKKGRARVAYASLCYDLMPTVKRGSISMVKPVGWVQKSYKIVSGGWLYNRCHLIGYQLTGVDGVGDKAQFLKRDLITGTRYLNVGMNGQTGMVKFENLVAQYIKENPENHVLYRVTPVYRYKNDKVARGVLMEGESLEDEEIEFCVFCYNLQPGIAIDYQTGKSKLVNSQGKVKQTAKKSTSKASNKSTAKKSSSSKATSGNCYITPTGKRYHLLKSCAGKNGKKTTIKNAKSIGLTPCQKCAK